MPKHIQGLPIYFKKCYTDLYPVFFNLIYILKDICRDGPHFFVSCHMSQDESALVYSISLHFEVVWIIFYLKQHSNEQLLEAFI